MTSPHIRLPGKLDSGLMDRWYAANQERLGLPKGWYGWSYDRKLKLWREKKNA